MHDDDQKWGEINDHFQTWVVIGFTVLGLLIMVAVIVQLT